MKKILFVLLFISIIFSAGITMANPASLHRGVWVTVFSENKVLYSREAASEMVRDCKKAGINEIYLQVYQSGKAYYDSKITDRTKYEEILKSAGLDIIDFLLEEAKRNNIKVFAWINLLSLGKNHQADILSKFGDSVLTKDQHLRGPLREEKTDLDKYYSREDQLFLEPGDRRVVDFLSAVVGEIITRYPCFSGLHFDYIRYPYAVPFCPGSRFGGYGLLYGYGQQNVESFMKQSGYDPLSGLSDNIRFLEWDNWRRKQVTDLIHELSLQAKQKLPSLAISCAVIPSAERAYTSAFQDWPLWLEKGIIDYVVLMNYSQDSRLVQEIQEAGQAYRKGKKVFAGIGLYQLKNELDKFYSQYKTVSGLPCDGIVIFSYDDLSPEIIAFLASQPV